MNSNKKNSLLNREKKIKSKLVQTRQIIQNKFRKVKKDRILRERNANEKYKPITQAIDKLNVHEEKPSKSKYCNFSSSDHETDWDNANSVNPYFSPMEYENQKDSRMRDSSSNDKTRTKKKLRVSHPKKLVSKSYKRRLYELKRVRQIRAEAKLKPTRRSTQTKSENDAHSESSDEDDIFVHPKESKKRMRLEKSALDRSSNLARIKNNKKIIEMRKANEILMHVKNKAIEESLKKRSDIPQIDISSDSEEDKTKDKSSTPFQDKQLPETITSSLERELQPRVNLVRIDPTHLPAQGVRLSETVKPKNKENMKGKKGGGGIEVDFIPYNENIVHEFYDDPNELCERLRLLIASRAAGNSNHSQEINSIISELREAGVIF